MTVTELIAKLARLDGALTVFFENQSTMYDPGFDVNKTVDLVEVVDGEGVVLKEDMFL